MEIDLRLWGRPEVLEHTILIRPAKAPPIGSGDVGEVVMSPWLTNRDLVDFAVVEDRAFSESVPSAKNGANPLPPPVAAAASANKGKLEPEKTTSVFGLIYANVTADPHASRTEFLIHNALTDPTSHFLKILIPSTGEIVGWAKWNLCLDKDTSIRSHDLIWAEGANLGLIDTFMGEMRRREAKWMEGKRYCLMQSLCVLPKYQGKGLGTRMLQWGLEIADREGVECWIDASPMGLGLYKKLGWKEVGEIKVDLRDWGGKKGHVETVVNLVRSVQKR